MPAFSIFFLFFTFLSSVPVGGGVHDIALFTF